MKITMLSVGSTGDVRPYILLGGELKKRGHEITIAAFSLFRSAAESAGLSFHPLSGDAEKFIDSIMQPGASAVSYLPHLEKSLRSVAPLLIRDLSDACDGADAMVCCFFGSVFYSIAEKHNIPCIQTQYAPMDPNGVTPISIVRPQRMGKMANEFTYKIGYLLIGALEKRYLTDWRESNGIDLRKPRPNPDYRIGSHTVPVLYAISPLVMQRPAEWDEHIHMTGFWFDDAPCEWEPPEDLVRFMENGPKPVYIGFGSMNSGNMNKTLTVVLRAIRAAGVRAVINLGWSGQKLKSIRNVYFGDYIPHDWLFPRVCAVVHHGGAGTTAAGLKYGKPSLAIPFGADQHFWGSRIHAIGCGPRPIARETLNLRRLTKALLDLTSNPRYVTAAREIGERLSQEHGTQKAADLIEKEIAAW